VRAIALLRGINVGGNKKLPMARLRALCEQQLGWSDVKTYVQSGNVVFGAPDGSEPRALADALERAIVAEFGFDSLVTVRTRDELAAIVEANPLGASAAEGKFFHVVFLSEAVDPGAVARIVPDDHAPEAYALIGRELYLKTPEGLSQSKLARVLVERPLRVRATSRNWRTVATLLELADA
jgi:uncharacterized protein (DUF1697 family)